MAGVFEEAIAVVVASLTPGIEPRYALIIGVISGLSLAESLILSLLGVFILGVVLTFMVESFIILARSACQLAEKPYNPACIYIRLQRNNARRLKRYLDRWGLLGLALFVALPLPATGMYTGATAALLLGVRGFKLAMALIAGGLASIAIVLLLSLAGMVFFET